jgi:alanyl-tRNA synthetase
MVNGPEGVGESHNILDLPLTYQILNSAEALRHAIESLAEHDPAEKVMEVLFQYHKELAQMEKQCQRMQQERNQQARIQLANLEEQLGRVLAQVKNVGDQGALQPQIGVLVKTFKDFAGSLLEAMQEDGDLFVGPKKLAQKQHKVEEDLRALSARIAALSTKGLGA